MNHYTWICENWMLTFQSSSKKFIISMMFTQLMDHLEQTLKKENFPGVSLKHWKKHLNKERLWKEEQEVGQIRQESLPRIGKVLT